MARSTSLLIRSLLFNALFYANLTIHMVVALPTFFLPYRVLLAFIRSYARTSLWLLRIVCGIKVEWRGIEKIPRGACIIACKHQSAWETFALYAVLRDPAYILKRELMWIPLFGWYTWKAGLIPVNREAGLAALSRMTALCSSRPVARRTHVADASARPNRQGSVRLREEADMSAPTMVTGLRCRRVAAVGRCAARATPGN